MLLTDVGSAVPDAHAQTHAERVADLACDLARERGFNDRSMDWFRLGARLHAEGARLNKLPREIRPMLRHHQERWDGTGYPDRLVADEIPLTARILAIADAFDELTTSHSSGDSLSPDLAIRIMASESGKAYDPDLLRIFVTRTLSRRRAAVSGRSTGDRRVDAADEARELLHIVREEFFGR